MCEKGVLGGGVNIKDPKPLYVMECQWGGEGSLNPFFLKILLQRSLFFFSFKFPSLPYVYSVLLSLSRVSVKKKNVPGGVKVSKINVTLDCALVRGCEKGRGTNGNYRYISLWW